MFILGILIIISGLITISLVILLSILTGKRSMEWNLTFPYWMKKIYWFFQRGFRGFGDNDTWDFDHYLATVISQGLKHVKKYHHGLEPNKKELQEMIEGFEANLKMIDNNINPRSKKYIILKIKFRRGMALLERYFNYLWD